MVSKLTVLALLICLPAMADMVRLKNGVRLDGTILSETISNLTMEIEMANGTITKTQTIDRDQIESFSRLSPAERLERERQHAYDVASRYRLDPMQSFEAGYYDKIIDGVFRKFLADYPGSPFEAEIITKIEEWQTEQEKVAAGEAKVLGTWMPAEKAAEMRIKVAARDGLVKAQDLARREKYEEAIAAANRVDSGTGWLVLTDIYLKWEKSLEDQLAGLNREIQISEQRIVRAQQSRDAAQKNLDTYRHTHTRGQLGYDGLLAQQESAVQRAEQELKQSEGRLGEIRERQSVIARKITEVRVRHAAVGNVADRQPINPLTTAQPEREADEVAKPTVKQDLLAQIGAWLGQYWYYLAGGAVIGLLLLSRSFR